MRVRLALGLDNLHDRLVGLLTCRVASVHRTAKERVRREHPAVRDVGVVRDSDTIQADIALKLHIGPEVLRIDRVECRERGRWRVTAPEDVAMHIAAVRDRGPLVGDQRRELAGLVEFVSRLNVPRPVGLLELRCYKLFHRYTGDQRAQDLVDRRVGRAGVHVRVVHHLPELGLRQRALRVDSDGMTPKYSEWSVMPMKSYGVVSSSSRPSWTTRSLCPSRNCRRPPSCPAY